MTTNDQYSTIEKLQQKWLSVIGIGEDGLARLSPIARAHTLFIVHHSH